MTVAVNPNPPKTPSNVDDVGLPPHVAPVPASQRPVTKHVGNTVAPGSLVAPVEPKAGS